MSEFRRFISYIYSYHKAEKLKNTGFAKIEARGEVCRMEIHIKGAYPGKVLQCNAYGFYRKNDLIKGVLLGKFVVKNGIGDVRIVTDRNRMGNTIKSLEELGGIYIAINGEEDNAMASEWDNLPVDTGSFRVHSEEDEVVEEVTEESGFPREENLEEVAQGENQEAVGEVAATGGVEITEEAESARNVGSAGEVKTAGEAELSGEIETTGKVGTAREAAAAEGDETAGKTESTGEAQLAETVRMAGEAEASGESGAAGEAGNAEKAGTTADAGAAADTGTAGKAGTVEEVRTIETVEKIETITGETNKTLQFETVLNEQSILCGEMNINVDNFQKSNEECGEKTEWKTLLREYPVVNPFAYMDNIEVIKVQPKDLNILEKKYWVLGSNSFLLHGYCSYRYLILGRNIKDDTFFIGIPGIFHPREKMMASMFGFNEFRMSRNGRLRQGEFGYYIRQVELG